MVTDKERQEILSRIQDCAISDVMIRESSLAEILGIPEAVGLNSHDLRLEVCRRLVDLIIPHACLNIAPRKGECGFECNECHYRHTDKTFPHCPGCGMEVVG